LEGTLRGVIVNLLRTIIFISILIFASAGFAFGPPSIQYNEDGITKYQKEDYGNAFDNFAKALARDPFNPAFHLNLGDSFYKNGELPKAISEYEAVESSPKATAEEKFKAMFNAGNASIETKDIPKALRYYQRALDYDPDSLEVKTNIELALKQQQGGGGKSDDKDKKDQQQGNNDKQQQDQKQNNQDQKKDQNQNPQTQPTPKPQPHGFKSQALNESDVRRILEELKRQEEAIRAKQYKERRDTPERQIEKDW